MVLPPLPHAGEGWTRAGQPTCAHRRPMHRFVPHFGGCAFKGAYRLVEILKAVGVSERPSRYMLTGKSACFSLSSFRGSQRWDRRSPPGTARRPPGPVSASRPWPHRTSPAALMPPGAPRPPPGSFRTAPLAKGVREARGGSNLAGRGSPCRAPSGLWALRGRGCPPHHRRGERRGRLSDGRHGHWGAGGRPRRGARAGPERWGGRRTAARERSAGRAAMSPPGAG